jgi:uncharacterized protein (DUF58 family)
VAPTPRLAYVIAAVGLAAIILPFPIIVAAVAAALAVGALDAWLSRDIPQLTRRVPTILSRAVPSPIQIAPVKTSRRIQVRQPTPPDISVQPPEQGGGLGGTILAVRRGHHVLPRVAVRSSGPIRLGQSLHRVGDELSISVFPDMVAAQRIAAQVRTGTFALEGRQRRGPIGLGTEFESIRAYVPGDDVRQVNWAATGRSAEPMVNQWRLEQDRDVVCVIDAGRLMGAPIGDRTRMDVAVDAAAAVASVADVVGDRSGVVAFRDQILRDLPSRHRGGADVAEAIFDLEAEHVESDYLLAFQHVAARKRALVIVLTDILEEAAARPLVEAMPILARHHSVVVASPEDPDVTRAVQSADEGLEGAARAVIALDVLAARRRAGLEIRRLGAHVVECPWDRFSIEVVGAYLRAKALARF